MKKNNISGNEDEKMVIQAKENRISNLNKNIMLLSRSINDQNKEIRTLCNKLEGLHVNIPDELKVVGDDVLKACTNSDFVLTNDQITDLDNIGRDTLDRKNKLDCIVKMQQYKIGKLKKMLSALELIPVNESIYKIEIESNKLENIKKQSKLIENKISDLTKQRDDLSKKLNDKFLSCGMQLNLEFLDQFISEDKKTLNNLNGLIKDKYSAALVVCEKSAELESTKNYNRRLIALILQFLGGIDQNSYGQMKFKIAGNDDNARQIIDSKIKILGQGKIDFKSYENDLNNLIGNKETKQTIENKCYILQNNCAKERKNLDDKIAQLKLISNKVRKLSCLDSIFAQQAYNLQTDMNNEIDSIMSQMVSSFLTVEMFDKQIQSFQKLTNTLMDKVIYGQNQNHGIFNIINNANMIHNTQNQNNNDIPQMENNIINEKQ